MGNRGEGGLEELQAAEDVGLRVDVEGGAIALSEGGEGGTLAGQGALAVGKGAGVADGGELRAGMVDDSAGRRRGSLTLLHR